MLLTDYLTVKRDDTRKIAACCGVKHAVVRLPEDGKFDYGDSSHWDDFVRSFTEDGFTPVVLEPMPNELHDPIKIGNEKRDEAIEKVISMFPHLARHGIRTVCFIAPVFPGITDFEAIFHQVRNQCDLIWLENLNLRGGFKKDILDYIRKKHPDLVPLYDAIYNKRDRSYFRGLEDQAERLAKENSCPFVDNELPYGRAEPGHPVIVDYFYHEEVRGSENTGKRTQKV